MKCKDCKYYEWEKYEYRPFAFTEGYHCTRHSCPYKEEKNKPEPTPPETR